MEDQISKHESQIKDIETKINEENVLVEEMRRDLDQLQVADRLQKRLETNLDKLVNKLNTIYEQIPNAAAEPRSNEAEVPTVRDRLAQLEQCHQTNFNQLQQCFNYKVDESISLMKSEMNWMKEQFRLLKEDQDLTSAKLEKLCASFEEMKEVPSQSGFIWVINGIEAKIKWPTMAEWSPVFKLHGYQFAAQVVMQTKNNDVFIFLSFKDTGNFRAFSKVKFLPRVTFSLCDANSNHDTNDLIRICDPQHGHVNYQYNTNYYCHLFCQKADVLVPKYIFNDSITMKIAVCSMEDTEQPASTNGTLTWTVDNYQKRRKMEENRLVLCQQSPWFYTSEKGYRVKAELELRYGTIKLRIFFISGEYDADLTPSFSHSTTVTLVDQAPTWLTRNDRTVSIRKSNLQDKSYELNLSLKSDLNDFRDNYLRDDSIIIKIEIQTSVPS